METSARLLQLLSLLGTRPFWSGRTLAERLEVSTRTVRNDIEKLRSLGYPVHSTPGVAGGYRLGAGAELPPLLLDDEEAVAVAIGLGAAAGGAVPGIGEASVRALAKLHQVLPSRLRHRVGALRAAVVAAPAHGPVVDPEILIAIASACRDEQRLRFDYTAHSGSSSRREVEPYRLVVRGGRWYLFAYDLDRDDWRTFRVDRVTPRVPTGPRFTPRELPAEGPAGRVDRGVAAASWDHHARVLVHAPVTVVAARLPPSAGTLTAVDDTTCALDTGADDPAALLRHLTMLDLDFSVADDPGLAAEARRLGDRLIRAASATRGPAAR